MKLIQLKNIIEHLYYFNYKINATILIQLNISIGITEIKNVRLRKWLGIFQKVPLVLNSMKPFYYADILFS
jgi:hypothetical protein